METVIRRFPKILHGGDYNPDQWLGSPEILKEDIRLLQKAHINCVSLGIFAWSTLEPKEGVYQLDWMQEIIDNLYEAGIYTVLATPSGAMPGWLTQKYPEVRQVLPSGVRALHGKRHNYCMTSPVMREKITQLDRKLAERFGSHPGVILWHISNEIGGNSFDGACYCPLCQAKFRKWVKNKYKTLDALNQAWWTTFWSHTYTDWSEIEAPSMIGEDKLHGLNLDWKRFSTDQLLDFYKLEADTVQQYSGNLPVTANLMYYFKGLDSFKFADHMTIASWDAYPDWHLEADEIDVAVKTAGCHNIMRSLKKAPFLLMENTPSITNWKPVNIQKRPGMHMLASMQAVALGSNSIQYFQIRKSRGSSEKFHGAVIGHSGHEHTREFREVEELGARLGTISDSIYHTINKPQVAIIFDWENWWAVDDACGPRQEMEYVKTVLQHYKPLWSQGVEVDFIDMDGSLDGYRMVIAPMTYMLKEGFATQVREFVKRGGTFVTTYWSGIVNETDLCFYGGFPGLIRDVMGITEEEIDAITEHYPNSITYQDKTYPVHDLCDIIHVDTAECLAIYNEDYYANTPAVTKNVYGDGVAYYIASRNDDAFHLDFYDNLIKEANIERNMNTSLPYGVTVNKRDGESQSFWFVQNFNKTLQKILLDGEYKLAETNEPIAGELALKPYECILLTK